MKILELARRGGAEFNIAGRQAIEKCLTMAASLNAILAARKLTQAEVARLLRVNQPKVSALKGYKLEGFSVERLMHFATALEHDVVIEIHPHAPAEGAGAGGLHAPGHLHLGDLLRLHCLLYLPRDRFLDRHRAGLFTWANSARKRLIFICSGLTALQPEPLSASCNCAFTPL